MPIFVWLNTDRTRPWRVECRPLPFSTPLPSQEIDAVRLWLDHVQKIPQGSEHLCPAKLQTRCDILPGRIATKEQHFTTLVLLDQGKQGSIPLSPALQDCLLGLANKVSRADDLGLDSRLRHGDFSRLTHTSDLKK